MGRHIQWLLVLAIIYHKEYGMEQLFISWFFPVATEYWWGLGLTAPWIFKTVKTIISIW